MIPQPTRKYNSYVVFKQVNANSIFTRRKNRAHVKYDERIASFKRLVAKNSAPRMDSIMSACNSLALQTKACSVKYTMRMSPYQVLTHVSQLQRQGWTNLGTCGYRLSERTIKELLVLSTKIRALNTSLVAMRVGRPSLVEESDLAALLRERKIESDNWYMEFATQKGNRHEMYSPMLLQLVHQGGERDHQWHAVCRAYCEQQTNEQTALCRLHGYETCAVFSRERKSAVISSSLMIAPATASARRPELQDTDYEGFHQISNKETGATPFADHMQVFLLLHDIPANNTPIEFYSMSQTEMFTCAQTTNYANENSRPPKPRHALTGHAGDIVIMDGRIVRRGCPNTKPRERMLLAANYGIGVYDKRRERYRPIEGIMRDLRLERAYANPLVVTNTNFNIELRAHGAEVDPTIVEPESDADVEVEPEQIAE